MKHADNLGRATPETRSRSSALDLRSLRHRGGRDQWVLVPDLLRQEQRPAERALLPLRAYGDLPVGGRGSDPGCRSVHCPPPSHPPRVDPASRGSGPLVSGYRSSATDELIRNRTCDRRVMSPVHQVRRRSTGDDRGRHFRRSPHTIGGCIARYRRSEGVAEPGSVCCSRVVPSREIPLGCASVRECSWTSASLTAPAAASPVSCLGVGSCTRVHDGGSSSRRKSDGGRDR
jgi:hypothetical protein